jgi:hypothetical protein
MSGVNKAKRSTSRSTVGCAIARAEPHVERRKGVIYTEHRRQTMSEITYVELDAHAETTAIAVAEPGGAAPRFIGTVGAKFAELIRALSKLGKLGEMRVFYEAGPCGFAMVRQLRQAGYLCEVVAPSKIPRKPGERPRALVFKDRRPIPRQLQEASAIWAGWPSAAPQISPETILAIQMGRSSAARTTSSVGLYAGPQNIHGGVFDLCISDFLAS